MKQISLIVVVFFVAISLGFAQKGKVNGASSSVGVGKLDKAKEDIDLATENEETKNWTKTWFVRGQVYQAIAEDQTGLFKKLDPDAVSKSFEAYKKALDLDKQPDEKGKVKPKFTEDIIKRLKENVKFDFQSAGIEGFNAADYKKALMGFESSLEIDQLTNLSYTDTAIVFNAGLSAFNCKEFDKAMKYYQTSKSLGYAGSRIYLSIAQTYKELKDTTSALKSLQEGIDKYPNDNQALINELINHHLMAGNSDEALKFIDIAIGKEPTNHTYFFAQGTLYERMQGEKDKKYSEAKAKYKEALKKLKLAEYEKSVMNPKTPKAQKDAKDKEISDIKARVTSAEEEMKKYKDESNNFLEKAASSYTKSIQLKPDYFEGNYNMGVIYIKKANKVLEQANEIDPNVDKDGSLFNAEKEKANNIYKEGLPFMEKALQVDPKDQALKMALKEIYVKLNLMDKAKELDNK
jgi:hypothetical protein